MTQPQEPTPIFTVTERVDGKVDVGVDQAALDEYLRQREEIIKLALEKLASLGLFDREAK